VTITAQDILERATLRENQGLAEEKESEIRKGLASDRREQVEVLREIGKAGILAEILSAERFLNQNDLEQHVNSSGMAKDLRVALEKLDGIDEHIAMWNDPQGALVLVKANRYASHQRDGLPFDEGRQSFRMLHTRLERMDSDRLPIDEKGVLAERRNNLVIGQKLYKEIQAKALGIDLTRKRTTARGVGITD
jgi:hypothetical protein